MHLLQRRYCIGLPSPHSYADAHVTHMDIYTSRYPTAKHSSGLSLMHCGLSSSKRTQIFKVIQEIHTLQIQIGFVSTRSSLAEGKLCHLTANHCIVPLRLLGNSNWKGSAMQHNSCLHNCTIKILKCRYFGHIHLNNSSSTSQHVFNQLG